MKLFSQRKGFKPVKIEMQTNSMDEDLKNGLWNAFTVTYWAEIDSFATHRSAYLDKNVQWKSFIDNIWHNYFKQPIDTLGHYHWESIHELLRDYYFQANWVEVYDFIEFCANVYPTKPTSDIFMNMCNSVLEREKSAYRFVGGQISDYISKEEIGSINEALNSPYLQVNKHLAQALLLYSNRKNPDYRNSVKESISAVESLCKVITKKDDTLGQLLKDIKIRPAMQKSLSCLYGYTSAADGIRHGMLEESTLDSHDAKFMLVHCSALINYIIAKSS